MGLVSAARDPAASVYSRINFMLGVMLINYSNSGPRCSDLVNAGIA